VGEALLEVYLNGQFIFPGTDTYLEVGPPGSFSSQIQIKRELTVRDDIQFRIDTTGGFIISGGSLNDAYLFGATITVLPATPVTITGPGGQKLFRVLGDMEVTGVIDPQGMTFTREGADPIVGFDGIYVDGSGDLIHRKDGVASYNLTQAASGAGDSEKIDSDYANDSGAQINKGIPVRIDGTGKLETINPSNESEIDAMIGVTSEDIADSSSGGVTAMGRIKDITTAISVGSPVFLSKTGTLTTTKPSEGVGGFTSGDFIVRVGVVVQNNDNPSNKDLAVSLMIVGQL